MILTIDNLAHRYKLLPSEILARGNTFDLYVISVSNKWQNYQHEKIQGKPTQNNNHGLSIEQMQAMMERARSDK